MSFDDIKDYVYVAPLVNLTEKDWYADFLCTIDSVWYILLDSVLYWNAVTAYIRKYYGA